MIFFNEKNCFCYNKTALTSKKFVEENVFHPQIFKIGCNILEQKPKDPNSNPVFTFLTRPTLK